MRKHKIDVTVEDSSIVVQPESLVMTLDDEVQWAGKNERKFSIEFEGEGPFQSRQLPHTMATMGQQARTRGRFKYTVVSEENPGLRLDPVIIVDPPPSGGIE